jgi:hypothetical protein
MLRVDTERWQLTVEQLPAAQAALRARLFLEESPQAVE